MPGPQREKMSCEDLDRLLVFYAWDELDPGEQLAVEEHARQCAGCAASLARELRLQQTIAQTAPPAEELEPAGPLLAQCRSELEEALDDRAEARARPSWREALRPANWLVRTFVGLPAWSAAVLVLLGILVGAGLPQWYRAQMARAPGAPALTVSASPRLSDQDLQTMSLAGVNLVPDSASGAPQVELRLTAEKPVVLQGSLDDTDVQRVLTFVIRNSQRFDPGLRLDTVDVLRARSSDEEVRQTLCAAARKDRNPGVRLKALEALRGFEQDDAVRQTLLEALLNDSNPGVRVEAINSIVAALRAAGDRGPGLLDPQVVQVLRDRMQRDPNNYVRLQSAAAIRQLGSRQVY